MGVLPGATGFLLNSFVDLTSLQISKLNGYCRSRRHHILAKHMFLSADMSNLLDRILDAATDNLRFAKILVQMGLDPNNVT